MNLIVSVGDLSQPIGSYLNFAVIFAMLNPLPPSNAVRGKKNEWIFSLVLSHFKKYHPSGSLKFNNLGISQSLKYLILMETNPFS